MRLKKYSVANLHATFSAHMGSPRFALAVFSAMNLLNYLDRYVPSAVKDLFKEDLHMSDAETSLPLTAFVIVYMVASPIFGSLADKWSRPHLIAAGVALWSLATAAASLATGFWSFVITRAAVGIGEAAYATISPALLADFYPPDKRNRVLTTFYAAIPVGAALGFTLGGIFGQLYGWRAAFVICGAPGLLVALLCFRVGDPGRGVLDGDAGKLPTPTWPEALRALRNNPSYIMTLAGYTFVTFAAGGMADWFPSYLSRYRGLSVAQAGSMVGTMTVVGGLGGTLMGGYLADTLKGKTRQPYFALAGVSLVPAAVFAGFAIVLQNKSAIAASVLLAHFFLWFYNGPVNTLIINATAPAMRARAFALSIFCIHLLGDAISPPIIGFISDTSGQLLYGVALIPVAMIAGAAVWITGWRRLA